MNRLYYGDNLEVLREHISDESVDLIYLDPPFNSQQAFNVFFKSPKGQQSEAQITAFEDTWHWGEQAEREFNEITHATNTDAAEMITALRRFLGEINLMAYLTMMTNRVLELHRILKPTGSLYLHCDPTASHYLKIVLDSIFETQNFRNEISWKRTSAHGNAGKRYAAVQDRILFYTKSDQWTWNQLRIAYSEQYISSHYSQIEPETGRRFTTRDLTASMQRASSGQLYEWKGFRPPDTRCWAYTKDKMEQFDNAGLLVYSPRGMPRLKLYLDEMEGTPCDDVWSDIQPINSQAPERLGYPTQKPLALLERIIQSSSNEGDIVLDPFCGCGTAVHAAQKFNRQWIGIDITHLAISLIEKRLRDAFPGIEFEVEGTPQDLAGARDLAERDKYQFQWWACSLVNAQPYQGKKKGADRGIDGLIFFTDIIDSKPQTQKIIVSVKGGDNVGVSMIRELITVAEQNGAQMALFVSLVEPTQPMIVDASKAGFYRAANGREYPRIQILTIEDLLLGRARPEYVDFSLGEDTFKKAQKEQQSKQDRLL